MMLKSFSKTTKASIRVKRRAPRDRSELLPLEWNNLQPSVAHCWCTGNKNKSHRSASQRRSVDVAVSPACRRLPVRLRLGGGVRGERLLGAIARQVLRTHRAAGESRLTHGLTVNSRFEGNSCHLTIAFRIFAETRRS